MKIFITGASGFIGSYLLHILVEQKHEVLSLKREFSDLYRVADIKDSVTWVNIESDWEGEVIAFQPDVIFNLAWNGVGASQRTNWDEQLRNIVMQQILLNIATICNAKKFIGIGSQAEYGAFENKIDETYHVHPNSAYGAVKNASFVLMRTFCELNGIEWYWFRVFPCFGPMEADNWLIPSLIKNICSSSEMDLTPGEQRLAYLYVEEVAKSIASVLNVIGKSGIYNICSDNLISLKDLVIKIKNKINPLFKLNFGALPYRPGQCMYMVGDTKRLADNMYKIDTSDFERHLEETIDYYLKYYKYGYR